MNRSRILIAVVCTVLVSGCTSQATNNRTNDDGTTSSLLSYGMVKKYVKVGESTQADVVKLFGAANNMTIDSAGNELWIYDQFYSESYTDSSSSSGGIGAAGGGAGGGGAGGLLGGLSQGQSNSTRRSTTRTLTVIIEFDKQGIVTEYSARSGGY